MKCPYTVNRYAATRTAIHYDSEGREDNSIVITSNVMSFSECLQQQCGAYNPQTHICEFKSGA